MLILTLLCSTVVCNEHGMCTEPPKEEGADCGGGDDSGSEQHMPEHRRFIDITATINNILPSWSV